MQMDTPPPTTVASSTPIPPTPPTPPPAKKPVSFFDAMAFSGPGPETINGRAAMIGVILAAVTEANTGVPVLAQVQSNPGPALTVFALVAISSLVPILGQMSKESQQNGIFQGTTEMINGRAAMLGCAAILIEEAVRGVAVF
jgi:hypothetical protein